MLEQVKRHYQVGSTISQGQSACIGADRWDASLVSHRRTVGVVLQCNCAPTEFAQYSGVAAAGGAHVHRDPGLHADECPAKDLAALGVPPVPVLHVSQRCDLARIHLLVHFLGGPLLSVIIPCYDEQESLGPLAARLRPVLDALDAPYEVILVDDGSRDRTAQVLTELAGTWPEVRFLRFGRNSGHQAAIAAGLDAAAGDYVVTMDADLQDPPELIPELLKVAEQQHVDVVYARKAERASDTKFKRHSAGLYYGIMRRVGRVDIPPHVGDFRLVSRRVVDVLKNLPEHHKVYRLMIPWLGYPSAVVDHVRETRVAGESKYSMAKMTLLAVNSLTAFTTSPLRIATISGFVVGAMSLIFGVWAIIVYLLGVTVPGWTSIVIPVYLLGAVQLISVGVLGEYVGRIFQQVQGRPLYHVTFDSGKPENVASPSPDHAGG